MDRLEYVAKALLVYETLDAEQFLKAFNKELPLDVLETKKDDETNNSEAIEKKETLSRELQSDTDLNRRDEFSQGKIDKDENCFDRLRKDGTHDRGDRPAAWPRNRL